jgi:hypothetical protein
LTILRNFMEELGARLVDNGYPVIPIKPGTKVPGRLINGEWTDYPGWTRHCDRETKLFELDIWKRWPGCGVAMPCGTKVVGIDLDILDAEFALKIDQIARRILGDTPALRIGRAPKRLLLYRADGQVATRRVGRDDKFVEILGHGRQFVAFSVHPETGKPYEWPQESPADLDLSSLPAVSNASIDRFLDAISSLLPIAYSDPGTHISNPDQAGTPEAIQAALQHIPNDDDTHYDDWVSIGLAIKGALGEAGFEHFDAWSARSKKYDPQTTAKKYHREFRPPFKSGAGKIYYLAQQAGWVPDADIILNGTAAEIAEQPNPAAELIARVAAKAAAVQHAATAIPAVAAVPPELIRTDGALAELTDYILATSISPQPFLALGASLCAIGALAGRKYRTPTNLRSNIYAVGIADSGAGKDHARRCIIEAFFAAGLSSYLGGNKLASGQGLLAALYRHPSSLFQLDEFGHLLAGVLSHRAPKHLSDIWHHLTELSTSAGGVFQGAEYADQRERPRQDIHQPCAVVYGTTVPLTFWKALEGGSLIDGSLARFLLFVSDNDYPERVRHPQPLQPVPDSLIQALQAVAAGADGHDYGGNLANAQSAATPATPYTVAFDTQAQAIFDRLSDDQLEWQRQARGQSSNAIIARIWEHTAKVALVRAVSTAPHRPVVTGPIAAWAVALVDHCVRGLLNEANKHVSDNETEAKHKRVLEVIRRAGQLTKNELARRTQFLNRRERDEIAASLVEAGQIAAVAERRPGHDKPTVIYSYVDVKQETSVTSSLRCSASE